MSSYRKSFFLAIKKFHDGLSGKHDVSNADEGGRQGLSGEAEGGDERGGRNGEGVADDAHGRKQQSRVRHLCRQGVAGT